MKTYCLILGLVGYLSALNGQHCRFFQYNVRNKSGQLECVDCPYCPTGQEPILKCAVKTEYQGPILLRCRKCQSGTYKRGSSPTPCRPCIKCPVNRVVLQNCTAFHPGECSERCIPGYYLNHDHYCVECCPCLGDSTDTVEPQCATVPGKKCKMNSADGICRSKPTPTATLSTKPRKTPPPSDKHTTKPKKTTPSPDKNSPGTPLYSLSVKPATRVITTAKPTVKMKGKTNANPMTETDRTDDNIHKTSGSRQSKTKQSHAWMIASILLALLFVALFVALGLWWHQRGQPTDNNGLYSLTVQNSPGDSPVPENRVVNKENCLDMDGKGQAICPRPEIRAVNMAIERVERPVKEEEPLLQNAEVSSNTSQCRRRSISSSSETSRLSGNRDRKQCVVSLPDCVTQVQKLEPNITQIYHIDQVFIAPLRRQNSESFTGKPTQALATLKEVEEADGECPFCEAQFGDELLADKIHGPLFDQIDCYLSKPKQCRAIYRYLIRESPPDISNIKTGSILLERLNAAAPRLRLASFIYVLKQESIRRNDVVKLICIELHKTEDGESKCLANLRLDNALPAC